MVSGGMTITFGWGRRPTMVSGGMYMIFGSGFGLATFGLAKNVGLEKSGMAFS